MLSASAVPEIVGVVSFVVVAEVVKDEGAPGAVASMVMAKGLELNNVVFTD